MRLLPLFGRRQLKIEGTSLILEPPTIGHFDRWLEVRTQSADFLQPWEPQWPKDDLSRIGYRRRLAIYQRHRQANWGRTFFIINQNTHALLGGLSLTRITRGKSRSATLGYWMGVNHANCGTMQRAVPALLAFGFNDLKLHRIEAASLPRNERSIHLLEKCGFQREGYAREFMEINGTREDHVLYGILKQDFLST